MWPQRQLDVFSDLHRGQGSWSGGRKEGDLKWMGSDR